jgi:hypothetical protein
VSREQERVCGKRKRKRKSRTGSSERKETTTAKGNHLGFINPNQAKPQNGSISINTAPIDLKTCLNDSPTGKGNQKELKELNDLPTLGGKEKEKTTADPTGCYSLSLSLSPAERRPTNDESVGCCCCRGKKSVKKLFIFFTDFENGVKK